MAEAALADSANPESSRRVGADRVSARVLGDWVTAAIIGSGSSGVIYRATHRVSGAVAAVKTLHVANSLQASLIRREVDALRAVDHPGVISIVDEGEQDGSPWYAMPLIDAPTLAEAIGESSREALLRTCMRLAQTLAHLHGLGLVHGDLKPENVFVLRGEHPMLVDFGLTSRFRGHDEKAQLDAVPLQGSPAYMAPEIIEGGAVDHRSDLYAFGCLLYECMAGRPPHEGSARDVMQAHVTEGVPRLVEPGVPDSVVDLVERLTVRESAARAVIANDAVQTLAALNPGAEGYAASAPHIHRPVLRGREEMVVALTDYLNGSGGAVGWLSGPSGVGKTFLAAECVRGPRAARRILHTCRFEELELESFGAIRPLLQEIMDWARSQPKELVQQVFEHEAPILASVEPGLLLVPALSHLKATEIHTRDQLSERLAYALLNVIKRWSQQAPFVLIIDNAHWMDAGSRAFFERVGDDWLGVCQARFLLIETDQNGGTPVRCPWSGGSRWILPGLDREHMHLVLSDLLGGAECPAELEASIVRASGGNPLYVAESLRAAVSADQLRFCDGIWAVDGAGPGVELPDNVRVLIDARIGALDASLRWVLNAVFVLNEFARLDRLVAMAALAEPLVDVSAATRQLQQEDLLAVADDGAVRFSHVQHQRVVAQLFADSEAKRTLHRAAAGVLERESVEQVSARAAFVAHLQAAGELERELDARLSVLDRVSHATFYQDALMHMRRLDELCGTRTPAERPSGLDAMLAFTEKTYGDAAAAEGAARRALLRHGISLPDSDRGWLIRVMVEIFRLLLPRWLRRVSSLRDAEEADYLGVAVQVLQHYFYFGNRPLPHVACSLAALRFADQFPEQRPRPDIWVTGGLIVGRVGLRRMAQRLIDEGQRQMNPGLDVSARLEYLLALADVRLYEGAIRESLAALQEAAATMRRDVWAPLTVAYIDIRIANAQHIAGDIAESVGTCRRLLEAPESPQVAWLQVLAMGTLARSLFVLAEGRPDEEVVSLCRTLIDHPGPDSALSAAMARGLLAQTLLSSEPEVALELAGEAYGYAVRELAGNPQAVDALLGPFQVFNELGDQRAADALKALRSLARGSPLIEPVIWVCEAQAVARTNAADALALYEKSVRAAGAAGIWSVAQSAADKLLKLAPEHPRRVHYQRIATRHLRLADTSEVGEAVTTGTVR